MPHLFCLIGIVVLAALSPILVVIFLFVLYLILMPGIIVRGYCESRSCPIVGLFSGIFGLSWLFFSVIWFANGFDRYTFIFNLINVSAFAIGITTSKLFGHPVKGIKINESSENLKQFLLLAGSGLVAAIEIKIYFDNIYAG